MIRISCCLIRRSDLLIAASLLALRACSRSKRGILYREAMWETEIDPKDNPQNLRLGKAVSL